MRNRLTTTPSDSIHEITTLTKPPPGAAPHSYTHKPHKPHKPALEALQQRIEDTKKLRWVYDPDTSTWLTNHDDIDWDNRGKYIALRELYVECGWPERFDGEEFMERYVVLGRCRGWGD
jgi:hypothetical protein